MIDDDAAERILAESHEQLVQSRQQLERLKEALTRVLTLIDEIEPA